MFHVKQKSLNMKIYLSAALIMLATLCNAQKWELGVSTGSKICINNLLPTDGLYQVPHSNEIIGQTGLFAQYKIRKHWSLAFDINYFKLTYVQSSFYQTTPALSPYYLNDVYYYGDLSTGNLESNLIIYYRFAKNSPSKQFIHKIHSSLGFSTGMVHSQQKYHVLQYDSSLINYPSRFSAINNLNYLTLGLNYLAEYAISTHFNLSLGLSFVKTSYLETISPHIQNGDFQPIDNHTYYYNQPQAFINYKLGITYKI